MRKNPSGFLRKSEVGKGDAAFDLTNLFWFGVGFFFCFISLAC